MPPIALTMLLSLPSVFMACAWSARCKECSQRRSRIAALVSWGIPLFECFLQVPGNRIDFAVRPIAQLRILQQLIALAVFVPFSLLYLRQGLKLDYAWADCCTIGAVPFMFRGPA